MADTETTVVDPEALMDAAVRMQSHISEIDGRLEDMHQWMAVAETFWKGAAAEAYAQRFEDIMMVVEHNVENCRAAAKRLETKAVEYGAVERAATAVAKEAEEMVAQLIEDADWADVMA